MIQIRQILGIGLLLSQLNTPRDLDQTKSQNPPDNSGPEITFDTTALSCDTISEGMVYEFVYHYQNTGSDSLILYNVRSSCGCYVPRWSKTPLAPGERDSIAGIYSSRGRPGRFTKSMTVSSNAVSNPRVILYCRGYAKPHPKE